ncbi:MAG: tetratricopeptide repeat protein [Deltaproteobacteria bacterium]|nr:tetratricopeptide repeat protein [Deltaproteobacteria bacterium]
MGNVNTQEHHWKLLVCLFLTVATLFVYWGVQNHSFIHFDDFTFIANNDHIRGGLSLKNVIWAFTTTYPDYWHPLPWLSHMLDYQLYGLNPKGHHFNNLLFHIANTILIFLVLERMTGALWRSAFVAALFAFHPLNVQPVAWATARKDVLSTFFFMLTVLAYSYYVSHPNVKRYLLVFLSYTIGLMAKPMLVTLPFVLLLLDYWPLGRFRVVKSGTDIKSQTHHSRSPGSLRYFFTNILLEKIPLIALAAVFSFSTLFAVQRIGGVKHSFPLGLRLVTALDSYVCYMGKMIVPHGLSILYPHPGAPPGWRIAGSLLLLVVISFLAVKTLRRHGYFLVGWLWYLGTLVPVIGLVQVGAQKIADRFVYVPLIGLFIVIAWGVPNLTGNRYFRKVAIPFCAGMALLILMIWSYMELGHWKNSVTLFNRAINVTAHNYIMHNSLGIAYTEQKRLDEAITHFQHALTIHPEYAEAHTNMGIAWARKGNLVKAMAHYEEALKIKPDLPFAHRNMGLVLADLGRFKEALKHFRAVQKINPDDPRNHFFMGLVFASMGDGKSALKEYDILKLIHISMANKLLRKVEKPGPESSDHLPLTHE